MSRIKSSAVYTSDIILTEKLVMYNQPPYADVVKTFSNASTELGIVPDIKRNPKGPDGYRAPSDYSLAKNVVYPNPRSARKWGFLLNADIPRKSSMSYGAFGYYEHIAEGTAVIHAVPTDSVSPWAKQQELRMKILNNIKDEAFNAAMVLAEIRKTASTAAGLMLRIGRSMDAIRRRSPESFNWLMHGRMGVDNRRPTDKFLRETAGLFLEWKYGIMPTVYDLEGITKQLDAAKDGSLFDRPPLMVARAHVKSKDTLRCVYSLEEWMSTAHAGTCTLDRTISARADFTVSGEGMRDLSEHGIGLTTLATVAYDMTPFSFVANMVVPMAEIISAWGALAGVDLRGYTETMYDKYKFEKTSFTRSWQMYKDVTFRIGESEKVTFTRTGSTSIPFPLPFIRNPVKVQNVATVLALFTQLRKRPKREPKLHGFDNKDL